LNSSSAVLIQEGKKACDSKTVLRDLAASKAHCRTLPQANRRLEVFGMSLSEALAITEKVQAGIKSVPLEYMHSIWCSEKKSKMRGCHCCQEVFRERRLGAFREDIESCSCA
jgi:hypothetical protein